jgi:hypothetical protein
LPQVIAFDAPFTFGRLATHPLEQVARLNINFGAWLLDDVWVLAALVGVLLPQPSRLPRLIGLLLFGMAAVWLRTIQLHGISAYYMIPLLSFVAVGVALLLRYGSAHVVAWLRVAISALGQHVPRLPRGWTHPRAPLVAVATMLLYFALVGAPLVSILVNHTQDLALGFVPDGANLYVNAADGQAALDYLNANATPQDLVIASPALAWGIRARTADYQIAAIYTGINSAHLPAALPRARYAYPAGYADARYVVLDNLWRNWAREIATVPTADAPNTNYTKAQMDIIETTWTLVFASGEIEIYENPNPPDH